MRRTRVIIRPTVPSLFHCSYKVWPRKHGEEAVTICRGCFVTGTGRVALVCWPAVVDGLPENKTTTTAQCQNSFFCPLSLLSQLQKHQRKSSFSYSIQVECHCRLAGRCHRPNFNINADLQWRASMPAQPRCPGWIQTMTVWLYSCLDATSLSHGNNCLIRFILFSTILLKCGGGRFSDLYCCLPLEGVKLISCQQWVGFSVSFVFNSFDHNFLIIIYYLITPGEDTGVGLLYCADTYPSLKYSGWDQVLCCSSGIGQLLRGLLGRRMCCTCRFCCMAWLTPAT